MPHTTYLKNIRKKVDITERRNRKILKYFLTVVTSLYTCSKTTYTKIYACKTIEILWSVNCTNASFLFVDSALC